MAPMASPPRFSPESLECAGALRNSLVATSAELGWATCLLDHVEGRTASDVHETHPTSDLTLVAATLGEHDVEILHGGRWRQAIYQVGAVGSTPGGETTRLRWRNRRPGTPFRTAHLYVPRSLLEEAAEALRRPGRSILLDDLASLVSRDATVSAVISSLLRGMRDGEPDILAETAVRWLAVDLVARRRVGGVGFDDLTPAEAPGDRRLARAVEFVTANLAHPIGVAEIAAEAGVSPFHFARLFRRATGHSPHAYLRRERLAKARRLLLTTDLPVAVVGAECGYPLPSAFSAAYSRRFGTSPRCAERPDPA